MQIELREIPIRNIAAGYACSEDYGVQGYNGLLNIRPAYQREFVYNDKQRKAVIDTIVKGFPLNVMYWVDTDGRYEVLDGQQRTISFCQYIDGVFSYEGKNFHNLTTKEQERILDYKLMIYVCTGTDREKLDWFEIINIAGEKLTNQELRNAVYTGPWLSDAKRKFSKPNCPAYLMAKDYMRGSPIRQDYLETVLKWISGGQIEEYMADHQHENDAGELWTYFLRVIEWVQNQFFVNRKEMKGQPWGELYSLYHDNFLMDPEEIEIQVKQLMMDDEVTNKRGIYRYIFSEDPRHLSIRTFSPAQKREVYEFQDGVCPHCGNNFGIDEMEADHITPWVEGGKTELDNCQMLCRECNRRKGSK